MEAYVGGRTASNDDFASLVTSKLPLFIAVIALLGLVLLVIAFRSLLIPVLGAVLNVLSIGVSFGTTVLVFQDGFGVSLPLPAVALPQVPGRSGIAGDRVAGPRRRRGVEPGGF